MDFVGKGEPLVQQDMAAALSLLQMDPDSDMPLLWAVLAVESRGFGFLRDRRPKILFERHVFYEQTEGRFAGVAPQLCAKTGGGYEGGAAEYVRLEAAMRLCRDDRIDVGKALRSASWGLGQIMGFNANAAGFDDVSNMVAMMATSEAEQLAGMASFIRSRNLHTKLLRRDWAGFARAYNGSGYWKNQYDVKLREHFEKFSSGITRDLRARAAQAALLFLGYSPGDPDGVVGQNTRRAISRFCQDEQLGAGDAITDEVFERLMKRAGLSAPLRA